MAFKAIKNCPLLALVRSEEISPQLLTRLLHLPHQAEQSEGRLKSASDNNHVVMSDQGTWWTLAGAHRAPWQEHSAHRAVSCPQHPSALSQGLLQQHWWVNTSQGAVPGHPAHYPGWPRDRISPGPQHHTQLVHHLLWMSPSTQPQLLPFEVVCSFQYSSIKAHVISP